VAWYKYHPGIYLEGLRILSRFRVCVSVCVCVCVWDYRRSVNWWMDLLTTCIHQSELHFTDHWHTHTRVLSLLQSPLAVFWQRLLPREIFQLPGLWSSCHSRPCRTDNSTNCLPGWRSFHTNLLDFSSQAEFLLTTELSVTNQLLHFTSLHSAELLKLLPNN
jgi:hypothetical protein